MGSFLVYNLSMKKKRFLLFVILIAFLLSRLPIYPAVYEVRLSYIDGGHELTRELVFGTLGDFAKDFKYIQTAWDKSLLPLNIFLGLFNIALCLIIALYGSVFIRSLWQKIWRNKSAS